MDKLMNFVRELLFLFQKEFLAIVKDPANRVILIAPAGGEEQRNWITAALKQAGPILLITGAGGAFGRVLQSTPLGDQLGAVRPLHPLA